MLIQRQAATELRQLATEYPVVVVVGPRQSGKTTLCRATFPELPYLSLEDPDQRRLAIEDPRGMLELHSAGALFDEVQRAPELLSYLQTAVDAEPRPGRFVLTGSQQLGVMAGVTQTLAGRAATLQLLPLSLAELQSAGQAPDSIEELLYRGLYPPIYDRDLDPRRWYGNYIQTYVERDVRQLINVRDLSAFQVFLKLCAGRTGQLLNASSLASDAGVTHNTARAWLSALEASFVVKLLWPHFTNFGKRLVKTPKLYFLDPALAASLLEITEPSQIASHPLRGALFETWVFTELLKGRLNRGLSPNLYFWRDRHGLELDFLMDRGHELLLAEAKSGKTVPADGFKALLAVRELAGPAATSGWLVHGGSQEGKRQGVTALPWTKIERVNRANCGS